MPHPPGPHSHDSMTAFGQEPGPLFTGGPRRAERRPLECTRHGNDTRPPAPGSAGSCNEQKPADASGGGADLALRIFEDLIDRRTVLVELLLVRRLETHDQHRLRIRGPDQAPSVGELHPHTVDV